MGIKLEIFLLISTISMFFIIIKMIRKRHLELKYSIVWIVILVAMFLGIVGFDAIIFISNILGIYAPVNAIFYAAFLGILLICFSLTIVISRQSNRIKDLAQELSILEHRIRDMEKNTALKVIKKNDM